jgi:hypothetical protein
VDNDNIKNDNGFKIILALLLSFIDAIVILVAEALAAAYSSCTGYCSGDSSPLVPAAVIGAIIFIISAAVFTNTKSWRTIKIFFLCMLGLVILIFGIYIVHTIQMNT